MIDIRFKTKSDSVASWLRTEVLAGRLQPGTQLLQEEIAEQLGVSSTPVREAFGMLEAEGFVERRPHRGVVVTTRNQDEVADANRIRTVLESYAVRELTTRLDPKVMAEMDQHLSDARAAMLAGDTAGFRRASNGFHLAIISGARSRSLSEIMNYMVPRSQLYGPVNAGWMPTRLAEHQQILEAIRAGDGKKAAELLTLHHQAPALASG
jgi:DNA-binding GntR family transcriptional regulator